MKGKKELLIRYLEFKTIKLSSRQGNNSIYIQQNRILYT